MTSAPCGRAPVAIRAADVALGDLGVDGAKAAAVPRQTRDGVALETDVIELEDQRIGRAAVDARTAPQDVVDMREVSLDGPGRVRPSRGSWRRDAVPPGPRRRPAAVTVGAYDLAARDLGLDGLARRRLG